MPKHYSSMVLLVHLLLSSFTLSCLGSAGRGGGGCSKSQIRIYQWTSGYTGLNVPQYRVQIVNESWAVKGVFDVHVSCADFASANLVDPLVFRRLGGSGDCLLQNGRTLYPGQVLSFSYSNSFPYNFSVTSLKC